MSDTKKAGKIVNVAVDRTLWNDLREFAHQRGIEEHRRYPTAEALRLAIEIFLRLGPNDHDYIMETCPRISMNS